MKRIKVKKDPKGNLFLDLEDFADIVDISKVKKYTLETIMDGETHEYCLILKFYDKKGNIIEAEDI